MVSEFSGVHHAVAVALSLLEARTFNLFSPGRLCVDRPCLSGVSAGEVRLCVNQLRIKRLSFH